MSWILIVVGLLVSLASWYIFAFGGVVGVTIGIPLGIFGAWIIAEGLGSLNDRNETQQAEE